MTAVISSLIWEPVGRSLTRFHADLDEKEFFIIDFDVNRAEGYQWALSIRHRHMAVGVLLHSHATLQEAKQAAARHIGDE